MRLVVRDLKSVCNVLLRDSCFVASSCADLSTFDYYWTMRFKVKDRSVTSRESVTIGSIVSEWECLQPVLTRAEIFSWADALWLGSILEAVGYSFLEKHRHGAQKKHSLRIKFSDLIELCGIFCSEVEESEDDAVELDLDSYQVLDPSMVYDFSSSSDQWGPEFVDISLVKDWDHLAGLLQRGVSPKPNSFVSLGRIIKIVGHLCLR